MKQQVINPAEGIYSATPDYVHAIELSAMQRLLLVSGTMGLDAEGQAAATLSEQLTLIWSNIRRILAEAGMTLDNVVRVTSYLTDAAFASENQKARPYHDCHGRDPARAKCGDAPGHMPKWLSLRPLKT
jgi:2-iminobutanoate/2-iminopropanoate deaminase